MVAFEIATSANYSEALNSRRDGVAADRSRVYRRFDPGVRVPPC
jgi:hypothetical protein